MIGLTEEFTDDDLLCKLDYWVNYHMIHANLIMPVFESMDLGCMIDLFLCVYVRSMSSQICDIKFVS